MTRLLLSLCASLTVLLLAAPARCADADLKADLAKMQGKWKGSVVSPPNALQMNSSLASKTMPPHCAQRLIRERGAVKRYTRQTSQRSFDLMEC